MSSVSIRDLRNHGGEVIDRVARGERITITRSGKPVAELRPLGRPALPLDVLIERRRKLPPIDFERFRRDIDELIDPSL